MTEARSNVYGLLATLFRAPLDASTLKLLRESGVLEIACERQIKPDRLFADSGEGDTLDALAIDFTQLFHGPRDHIPPYESIAASKTEGPELMSDAAASVSTFISNAGLECRDDFATLPDHISVELEFMASLLRNEAESWNTNRVEGAIQLRQTGQHFLERHLGAWGPEFGDRIAERAQTPLYRTVGQLLADFLRMEMSLLHGSATPAPD